jgi:hypothetical protein
VVVAPVLAIVAVGATVTALDHPSKTADGHAAAPLATPRSPSPSRSTPFVTPSFTPPSGQTCTTQGARTLCGSYWFSDGSGGSGVPPLAWSAIASAARRSVVGAAAPASGDVAAMAPTAPMASETPPVPSAAPTPPAADPVVRRLTEWDRYDAECVVVVDKLSEAEAVRRMGGDGKHIPADTDPSPVERSVTQVGTNAGHTVLTSDNAWGCNDDSTLKRLSAGGVTAVTAYWSADADTMLSYAKDGAVLATWDPIIDEREGSRLGLLAPHTKRVLPDVESHPYSAMVAVVAAVTGVEVPADSTADYTVWIPNP